MRKADQDSAEDLMLRLLGQRSGFLGAVSLFDGEDFVLGFRQIAVIRRISGTPAFVSSPLYRREVMARLGVVRRIGEFVGERIPF